jgi:hypothetical protein
MIYILNSTAFFRVFCIFLNGERSKNDGTSIFWEPQKMRTRWYIISFLGNYIIFILSALMCDVWWVTNGMQEGWEKKRSN